MSADTGKIVLWRLGGLVVAFVAPAIGCSTALSRRSTHSWDDAAKVASRVMPSAPKASVP